MNFTEHDGVTFFEGYPPDIEKGGEISTSIEGVFRNAQLASLRDVKSQLALECKRMGCNAIVGFTYGQKSSGFFASIISRDDITWYGNGYVANVHKK